ncbi:putative sodium-dependent multivitamin transporter [Ceratina calcarata]|uniref:Sodium-dependent multivitamin transporter n=1 Tax=Ceratina calcarata TaxID=156304 RepID=A0AAJ7WC57_9HYME|nr:putative sodium-dependent multivitamin transporter [Ceratina calcarata]
MAILVAADYAVIAVTLIISSGIGVYYWLTGGKQNSTEEYFMADRSMRAATIAIGLTVSYLSAVSLLGVSSENYVYGTQYAVINLSYGLATPFVAHLYMPVFFKLGTTSAFEWVDDLFGCYVRYSRNVKGAQTAIWWSWPLSSLMSLGLCFSGLAIYTKYRDCDPLQSGRINSYDQLMPLYVMDMLSAYPGVPGLFIAGIFSAGLSTISATVNSLAAVILEDFIKPLCRLRGTEITTTGSIITSKILAVAVGAGCIALAFIGHYLGGLLQAALTIFGVVGGPVFGMFTLGMFTRSANQRGAIIGLLISLVFSLWIGFGQPKPPIPNKVHVSSPNCGNATAFYDYQEPSHFEYQQRSSDSYFYLYRISYMWYCPLGSAISFLVGWIASWISNLKFGKESRELEPDLFVSILAKELRRKRLKNTNEVHRNGALDTIS